MNESTASTTKRPAAVWVITLFNGISVAFTVLSLWLAITRRIPVDAAGQAYFSSLTTFDWVITCAIGVTGVAGTIALFMLKRPAPFLFAVSLSLNVLQTVLHATRTTWLDVMGTAGLVGALAGMLGDVAILIYSRHLRLKGILR